MGDGRRSVLSRWGAGLVAVGAAQGARARVELAGLAALVAAIGVTDHATGFEVRFGVFYLLPVSVATVRCGPRAALWLAGAASLANVGLPQPSGSDWALEIVNLLFRFSMFAFVIGVLSLLVRTIDEARGSERRSREFLRYAAHQLRTPTTSVSTTAQALLAAGHRPPDEGALLRLVSESDRMGRLVTSMLRFVRLERGDALSGAVGDLRTICREEVLRWSDLAAPVSVSLALPEGTAPLAVPVEAIREVLEILLDNGARHAVHRIAVVVEVDVDRRRAQIRVSDDGPGPPPGEEEQIFTPFASLDGRGGSGLGLAIGRRLAEAVGGSLRFESGAFVASVPVTRGAATGAAAQDGAKTGWPGSGGLVNVQ